MTYQKILVINLLHIGDLLLATPALRALRAEYPQAHITLLADAKIDALVKYNQHIDELISVDKKGYHNKLGNYLRLIADIRHRKFDLVINMHPNERATAIAAFSGAKEIVGYACRGVGILFNRLVINKVFDRNLKNRTDIPHQVEQHLQMLEQALGITYSDKGGLDMWLDGAALQKAEELWFTAFGKEQLKVIGLNTGAGWPTKRWTTAGFAAVAD
jgi:heptosyltransferase-2